MQLISFSLFLPSLINWLIPAIIMSFVVTHETTDFIHKEVTIEKGGFVMTGLFLLTLAVAVSVPNFLSNPGAWNDYGFRIF
ncbi:MAG: hypothetical protein OEY89_12010 [Gammaproteobacteria bacterium]|nr:hypothetical protein [Gammaproteobacteria bacterium]